MDGPARRHRPVRIVFIVVRSVPHLLQVARENMGHRPQVNSSPLIISATRAASPRQSKYESTDFLDHRVHLHGCAAEDTRCGEGIESGDVLAWTAVFAPGRALILRQACAPGVPKDCPLSSRLRVRHDFGARRLLRPSYLESALVFFGG